MKTNTTHKERGRTVKAWAVYSISKQDISDTIFTTKLEALDYYDIVWRETKLKFPNLPEKNLRNIRLSYKVIPVVVTYSLPNLKKTK